jgi:hypothetical protein
MTPEAVAEHRLRPAGEAGLAFVRQQRGGLVRPSAEGGERHRQLGSRARPEDLREGAGLGGHAFDLGELAEADGDHAEHTQVELQARHRAAVA